MWSDRKICSAAKAAISGAAIAAALLIAGCGGKAPPPAPPPAAERPAAEAVVLAPADYVREMSSISLLAVRVSQLLAARNVGDSGLARTIEQEQGGIGAQLSYAGRRLDLLPSAQLLAPHAEMLARLEASSDPARDYRVIMATVLARGAAVHESFAARGASPSLRPVAAMAAPTFRRELDLLRRR